MMKSLLSKLSVVSWSATLAATLASQAMAAPLNSSGVTPRAPLPNAPTPAATKPSETIPPPTSSSVTTPSATPPSTINPSSTLPSETAPTATKTSVTAPASTLPSATNPSAVTPTVTTPSETAPSTTNPSSTNPSAVTPTVTTPSTTAPSTTNPSSTKPSAVTPTVTTPSATIPSSTKPSATTLPDKTAPTTTTATNNAATLNKVLANRLVLVLGERRVYAYQDDKVLASYPVAVGKKGWETPTGNFQVIQMVKDPVWQNPWNGKTVPASLKGPIGIRWIGFWSDGKNTIGFHGTPGEHLLGQAVSHGCVRMKNKDVVALFEMVQPGTPVIVKNK